MKDIIGILAKITVFLLTGHISWSGQQKNQFVGPAVLAAILTPLGLWQHRPLLVQLYQRQKQTYTGRFFLYMFIQNTLRQSYMLNFVLILSRRG